MDSSMWQTLSKTSFIHSFYSKLSTILSCGSHDTALSFGIIPRLRLCWWSWRLGIKFVRIWCLFGRRTCVLVNWMCEKQTSVTHTSTEFEIISLDTGVRMDTLTALGFRNIVIQVLRSPQTYKKPSITASGNRSKIAASSNGSTNRKWQTSRKM